MSKKLIIIILILSALVFSSGRLVANAGNEQEDGMNIEELIDNLDLSQLDAYFDSLSDKYGDIIGVSAGEYIKDIISGERKFDLNVVFQIIFSSVGQAKNMIGIISLLVAMCIVWSLTSGIEFKNVSNSAKKAVNIACLSIMSVIILYWIYTLIGDAAAYFDDIQNLCNAIFPVFVTLLSVSGANASASALSPAAAVFSAALIGIVKNIVIPIAIAVLVLSVAGNLSDDIPLDGLRALLENVSGWIMRTGFFVFAAFLGTQGIFTGISDNISMRLGKFALSKYVPIIGGYLSDGFNYVVAGSIVIKNALGLTAVVLVFLRALPIFITLVMASLSLNLVAAIAEPLGIKSASKILFKIDGCIKTLRAAVIGCAFLLIIFIGAVMMCGNTVL